MATFGITTPGALLDKLIEEQHDFETADCLSARHAINAIMTAYHLHEWVWGAFVKERPDLQMAWELSPGGRARCEDFLRWLKQEQQCPAMAEAQKVTNGTKHFNVSNIPTGQHEGAFSRDAFQPDAFDVSYFWIERNGRQQPAEKFIEELVEFWNEFFTKHEIP